MVITIKSALKNYQVSFTGGFHEVNELFRKDSCFAVVDRNVLDLYKDKLNMDDRNYMAIEAVEENKVIDRALEICERLMELPSKRNTTLISVGGGIIQDITGFAASILYRGIRWLFVPTTVLSACDSCIGGKTSVNYAKYKNLLGTFYPPDEILICPQFFQSLSEKDYKSGLGEVVKFNLMQGESGLSHMSSTIDDLLIRREDALIDAINASLLYKKKFIERDEFDRDERIKLNFAHTFGHVIEVVSSYEIPHGTAVAIGMVMADSISVRRGLLSKSHADECRNILMRIIDIEPDCLGEDINRIIGIMGKDKKQTSHNGLITAVLRGDFGLSIVSDVTVDEVRFAFDHFVSVYESHRRQLA